ncbi:hypothetical protein ZIOFF_039452 [Zingiber officinale]|uniref:Uncharacterized protein n=1 Tax=Zingiber officinale TaxID=94328 RepID=A0A8J5L067_ZINOF|nr:hypothetical protein ZIOFF_039452 [Zingiber officinale]
MEKQSTTPVTSNEDIVIRKTSKYHPTIWGDYFIHHTSSPALTEVSVRAEELKEQIKNLFRETSDILQIMNLIDAIQLLGLDYHFEKEIDAALSLISKHDAKNYELYETSLWFRLLRQHGFYVPPDVFNKFKDEEGNFMSTLNEDVKGLLSLYNVAYLRIHGEYILDEAILFTKNKLVSLLDELKQPLVILVSLFLETPLCRRNKRLLARKYIPIYQEEERRNDAILEFAKLDFNLLQSLHQEELKEMSMWEPQAIDEVPEYLKDFYLKLLRTFKEFENELESDEKYRISFLQDELEQQRGHAASTVECYMKEFTTDKKEAYKNLMAMVEDAWKDHNKECLNPIQVPRLLIEKIVNFSRVIEEFYKYIDTYTYSKTTTKDNVNILLVESVLI